MSHYSREQLIQKLPQQPPFLFLDHVDLDGDHLRAGYRVKGSEDFLAGHFKGNPVFPASIVFEAMGQAACLWLLEQAPARLAKAIRSDQLFFASLGQARFLRPIRPGDELLIEEQLVKLREPLAVFAGTVTVRGQRAATVERLILAFGGPLPSEGGAGGAAGSS